MTSPHLVAVYAEQRGAELRREAQAARLAAMARCCRPSAVANSLRRVATLTARLGTGLRSAPTACCAPA